MLLFIYYYFKTYGWISVFCTGMSVFRRKINFTYPFMFLCKVKKLSFSHFVYKTNAKCNSSNLDKSTAYCPFLSILDISLHN